MSFIKNIYRYFGWRTERCDSAQCIFTIFCVVLSIATLLTNIFDNIVFEQSNYLQIEFFIFPSKNSETDVDNCWSGLELEYSGHLFKLNEESSWML